MTDQPVVAIVLGVAVLFLLWQLVSAFARAKKDYDIHDDAVARRLRIIYTLNPDVKEPQSSDRNTPAAELKR